MQKFDLTLPGSGLRATCTKIIEKHPPSIMAMNMTAIEEEVTVYMAEVTHQDGSITEHRLVRDKNGHWQLNLLEDINHKIVEELQRAIEQYDSRNL